MPEVMQTANSYSPQGHKEADTTEATELMYTVFIICTLSIYHMHPHICAAVPWVFISGFTRVEE